MPCGEHSERIKVFVQSGAKLPQAKMEVHRFVSMERDEREKWVELYHSDHTLLLINSLIFAPFCHVV